MSSRKRKAKSKREKNLRAKKQLVRKGVKRRLGKTKEVKERK